MPRSIVCNMFGSKSKNGNGMASSSPLSHNLILFVLLSYVLQHYNWEKDIIDKFEA
jgi:hypothetical protein